MLCLCKTRANHVANHDKLADDCRARMIGNNQANATDINVEGVDPERQRAAVLKRLNETGSRQGFRRWQGILRFAGI